MEKLYNKLKKRLELDGFWHLALILFLFSLSGTSVLFLRQYAFNWLGFTAQTPLWKEAVAWLLIVVPSYQLLFITYGTILGQFEFVWQFEKNNLQRLKKLLDKITILL